MPGCCVPLCKNRSGRGSGEKKYSFHRFPACREKRQLWMKMIRRDDFIPTPNTRVCSWHFADGFDAGPTRFHWNVKETSNAQPLPAATRLKKKKFRGDEANGLKVLADAAQSQSDADRVSEGEEDLGQNNQDEGWRMKKRRCKDHGIHRDAEQDCGSCSKRAEQFQRKEVPSLKTVVFLPFSNEELKRKRCSVKEENAAAKVSTSETIVFLPLLNEDFKRKRIKVKEENARLKQDLQHLKMRLTHTQQNHNEDVVLSLS